MSTGGVLGYGSAMDLQTGSVDIRSEVAVSRFSAQVVTEAFCESYLLWHYGPDI